MTTWKNVTARRTSRHGNTPEKKPICNYKLHRPAATDWKADLTLPHFEYDFHVFEPTLLACPS